MKIGIITDDVSKAVEYIKNAKYPDYENILKFFYV